MLKDYDALLSLIPKDAAPLRAVLAGSDGVNRLKGMFDAKKAGYVDPILVGDKAATEKCLAELGLENERYTMVDVPSGLNVTQAAIDVIRSGDGDILMRGNIMPRKFLSPLLNRETGLRTDKMISHVAVAQLPEYPSLLAIADMVVNIEPDLNRKRDIIKNTSECLQALGVEKPTLAMLALMEKVTFHMRDTVDAQSLVMENARHPISNCTLWGPISYDLIMSKEACRLKKYDCPYSENFDGVVAPDLTLANTLVKSWLVHGNASVSGVLMGAQVPIAFTSRSASAEGNYLSLALACILYRYYEQQK